MRLLVLAIFFGCAAAASAQDLTPQEAMRRAAQRLPSVQAARALLESAQRYAAGIGAQPNPLLRLSGTAGEPQEEANALVFRFEVAGQPRLREEAARREAEAKAWDLAQERRQVALRTGQTYYALWERQQNLRLALARVDLAANLERSALRRWKVGEISHNSYLRAQLELTRAQADQAGAEVEQEGAQGLLNLLLGEPLARVYTLAPAAQELPQAPPLPLELPVEPPPPEASELPEVKSLAKQAESLESQTELARRANSPELQLQLYRNRLYAHPNAEQGLQLTLNIPLWDNGQVQAEVDRREGLARAASARVAEKELLIRQLWLEAATRYRSARRRSELLGQQAERFLRLSLDARRAYDANLMTLLEVFDVQQAYRQALQSYVAAEAERARAALELAALRPDGFFEEVSREP
jgi:outer membrane protein TolC